MKEAQRFLVTPKEVFAASWRRTFLFSDLDFIEKIASYAASRVIDRMKKRNESDDPSWVRACVLHSVFMAGYMQGKREERQRRKRDALKRP